MNWPAGVVLVALYKVGDPKSVIKLGAGLGVVDEKF